MNIFTNERTVSLEEMTAGNDIILVDTSYSEVRKNNIPWDYYHANDYNSMDSELLLQENKNIQIFIEIMRNTKSKTIQEVASEMKRYAEILGDKISFISKSERDVSKNGRRGYIERSNERAGQLRERNRKSFTELQENVFEAYRLCDRKKIKFDTSYKTLVEMIKLIEGKMKMKRDLSYGYLQHETPDTSSDTDEKLSAALLHACLSNDQKSALLTRDSDFIYLLSYASRIIGADAFLPQNEFFRRKLNENPFRLYFSREGMITEKSYDTIYFCRTISFHSLSDKENLELKEKLENLWERLYREINQMITS